MFGVFVYELRGVSESDVESTSRTTRDFLKEQRRHSHGRDDDAALEQVLPTAKKRL